MRAYGTKHSDCEIQILPVPTEGHFTKLILAKVTRYTVVYLGGKIHVEHVLCAMKYHTRVNLMYMYYWHAHGMPFYTPATRGVMNENDAHIPHVLHSISRLLCAVLALGSATCTTKNSMFVTPVSAHIAHAIIMHRGVGRQSALHNFRVVWHANIVDFP